MSSNPEAQNNFPEPTPEQSEPYFGSRKLSLFGRACIIAAGTYAALCGVTVASAAPEGPVPNEVAVEQVQQAPEVCDPAPDSAPEWSALMQRVRGWSSGDGISSVILPNNKIIISGGDNIGAGNRFNRNAMISVCGDEAASIKPTTEIIPSVNDEWYWPGEMIVDDNKLYVFAGRTGTPAGQKQGVGAFEGRGTDLAVFSVSASAEDEPELLYMAPTPGSNKPEVDADGIRRNVQWGSSVVKGEDGDVYVFGSVMESRPYNMARSAYVARVASGELEQPGAWLYWNGSAWTESEQAARPVIDSAKQPGLDATWTTVLQNGRYSMISKRDGFLGNELGQWSAASPIGPFEYHKLGDLPPFDAAATQYNAHSHTAGLASGKVLVSICQGSNGDLGHMIGNPPEHSPVWVEVAGSADTHFSSR